jgi:hypothetical protein
MASIPLVLPSARLFIGPGDSLFEYGRIWVVLYAGAASRGDLYTPSLVTNSY